MKKVRLSTIAHARSGDKGNHANIGLIVRNPKHYSNLKKLITIEFIKKVYGIMPMGKIEITYGETWGAINILIHDCLRGGGGESLYTDTQGKLLGSHLIRQEVDVDEKDWSLDNEN